MPTRIEAEENLRVIRSLMERATIYRAISAPTALTGGLVSLVVCAVLYVAFTPVQDDNMEAHRFWFLALWLCALAITIVANTYFIKRGAKLRNEPFISPGMKLALVSLLPSILCAGFFTLFFSRPAHSVFYLPAIWMICYGLGLLSTSSFAPHSIALLGWTFLVSGFVACCLLRDLDLTMTGPGNFYTDSNLLMGLTFGVFHIIYAGCTWPRKASTTNPGDEP